MRPLRAAFGCFLAVLLTASLAAAQATAELSGIVRDESGAVLPGVTVTITQADTGFTVGVGDLAETVTVGAIRIRTLRPARSAGSRPPRAIRGSCNLG